MKPVLTKGAKINPSLQRFRSGCSLAVWFMTFSRRQHWLPLGVEVGFWSSWAREKLLPGRTVVGPREGEENGGSSKGSWKCLQISEPFAEETCQGRIHSGLQAHLLTQLASVPLLQRGLPPQDCFPFPWLQAPRPVQLCSQLEGPAI